MSDLKGMAYLRRRLLQKRVRVQTRYKYYEMKNAVKDFGMVTPPEFRRGFAGGPLALAGVPGR